ncbi:MAG: hypothetical protein EON55_05580, partial [Alphaproteobacteria bacterium]
MSRLAAVGAAVALLGGCSLIPDYSRPDLPVTPAYPTGPAYIDTRLPAAQTGPAAVTVGWREFFPDRRLQALIAIALQNNRNLRVAALNVERAQAQFRVQRSDLFPHISLSGIGQYGTLPESTSITSSGAGAGAAAGAAGGAAALGSATAVASAPTSLQTTGRQHISYRYYN